MRRLLLPVLILFSFRLVQAQIGINTENPLTLFHVDAAGDNSASPTAAQLSNDVAITASGDMGIGTLTPSVKLEIANTSGTTPNLRIVDGSTMTAKVLESDANGVGRWTDQPPSYTKVYNAATPGQKFPYDVMTVLTLNTPIIIPQTGKYLLTLRWWGYNRMDYNSHSLSGYIYVRKVGGGANYLDQIEYYMEGTTNDVLTFTTSFYLGDRVTGDAVEIVVKPLIGGGSGTQWELFSTASGSFMPLVILYSI